MYSHCEKVQFHGLAAQCKCMGRHMLAGEFGAAFSEYEIQFPQLLSEMENGDLSTFFISLSNAWNLVRTSVGSEPDNICRLMHAP